MEILEEILESLKQINRQVAAWYENYGCMSFSNKGLESKIVDNANMYESIKSEYSKYRPFYSRGNSLFKAIETADKIIIEMYALLSGKYDKTKCEDCSWKYRVDQIKALYSKLKKKNVMGSKFYQKELEGIVEILEKSPAGRKLKRKVKKITKKIRKKIGKKKNGRKKHSDSGKA